VQMLPYRLWSASVLEEDRWRSQSLLGVGVWGDRPGLPNVALASRPASYQAGEEDMRGKVAFPLLSLAKKGLLAWCDALSGKGEAPVNGRAWALPPPPDGVIPQAVSGTAPGSADTDRIIRNLRATMPPRSRELVGSLASATPLTLPILRMLVREFCPDLLEQGLVLEILLRGILEQLTPDERATSAEEVEFEFVGDLREKLLYSMPLDRSRQVLQVVSDYQEQRSASFVPYARLVAFLSTGREEDVPDINQESLRYARVAVMVFAAHSEPEYRTLARLLTVRCDACAAYSR
jgi:hypothetical protein